MDQSKGAGSAHPPLQTGNSRGSWTLRYPQERRSRPPGEHTMRCMGRHGDRAAVHLGGANSQTDIRGMVNSQSKVGSRQQQQALWLQPPGLGGGQETYPNDKCKIAGRQILQTTVSACTHWNLTITVRPSRG